VSGCRQLMEAHLLATCPSAGVPKRREVSLPPPSPIGVLDAAACGSCDSQRSSAPAEPRPLKRRRLENCTDVSTGEDDGLNLLCND
jgi:cyclin D1/2/4, plant